MQKGLLTLFFINPVARAAVAAICAFALTGCGVRVTNLKKAIAKGAGASQLSVTGQAFSPLAFNEDTQSGVITLPYTDTNGGLATSCSISNLSNVTETQACSCDIAGVCTVRVTGATNYFGPASFDYTVTVGSMTSLPETATLTILNVDDAPVAINTSPAAFNEDVQSGIIALPYTDVDSDLATLCSISNLSNVTVTQACACAAGICTVRVTGTANYNGAASFDFTVTAGGQTSNTATASLTIDPVPDNPVAYNITPANFNENTQSPAITLSYTDGDGDLGTSCSITNLSNVTETQACACVAGVCTVRVTGDLNYDGPAGFDYTVTAGGQATNSASASFNIIDVATAPVASNISPPAFNEDTASGAITLSYTDPQGDLATSCSISNPTNVTVTTVCSCDGAGVCTVGVTGTANYNGSASFEYTITANGEASNTATASLTINAVDDAPLVYDITPASFNEDTQSGVITLSYTDVESDSATACALSNLVNVTETTPCACVAGVCTVRVTGTANYNGAASFDYTVTAGGQTSAVAETATLTISAVNDAPVISAISDQTTFGISPAVVNFTVTDVDSTLTCTSTYLSMSSSNTTLVPNANVVWSGTIPNCTATITAASITSTGTSTITISASDGSLSDDDDFVLTVLQQALTTVPTGYHSVIADFDGDGKNDVAVSSNVQTGYPNGAITVYYGNDDGTFDGPTVVTGPTRLATARKMIVADMNNDTFPDIVSQGNSHSQAIIFSDGAGRDFTTVETIPITTTNISTSSTYEYKLAADFNHDGNMDLIYGADYDAPGVDRWMLRLHDGTPGSYTAANWGAASSEINFVNNLHWGQHVSGADLNGDTHLDLVLVSIDMIRIIFGDGIDAALSTFDLETGQGSTIPECAELGDINGDGHQDIFVSYWTLNKASVYTNDGAGNFTRVDYDHPHTQNEGCLVRDMNLDGVPDFVTTSTNGQVITVLYGDGAGGLDDANPTIVPFPQTTDPNIPGVGDLNGDTCPDLSIGSKSTSNNTLLIYNKGQIGGGQCSKEFFGL